MSEFPDLVASHLTLSGARHCVESNTPESRNQPVAETARRAADAAASVLCSADVTVVS
jgi:hypothetical protein